MERNPYAEIAHDKARSDDDLARRIRALRSERQVLEERYFTARYVLGQAEREWARRGLASNDQRTRSQGRVTTEVTVTTQVED